MATNLGGIDWEAKQDDIPEGGCENYDDCENMTPGGTETENSLCTNCLDTARYRDSSLGTP